MNKLIYVLTLILLVALAFPAPASSQDCTKSVDEYTGQASIKCEAAEVGILTEPRHKIVLASIGMVASQGERVVRFLLTTYGQDHGFRGVKTGHAIIDDGRYEFDVTVERKIIDGVMVTHVVWGAEPEVIREIATARTFKVRIGQGEFSLSPAISQSESLVRLARQANAGS